MVFFQLLLVAMAPKPLKDTKFIWILKVLYLMEPTEQIYDSL